MCKLEIFSAIFKILISHSGLGKLYIYWNKIFKINSVKEILDNKIGYFQKFTRI